MLLSSHSFCNFFVDSFEFPTYTIISLANKRSFNIFYLIFRHIIFNFAFCPYSFIKYSTKVDKAGYHFLVTNFSRETVRISQSIILFVGFSLMDFIQLRKHYSILGFLSIFKVINTCQIMINICM